jgi:hypothetical protein
MPGLPSRLARYCTLAAGPKTSGPPVGEAAILRKVSVHVEVGSMAVTRPNRVFTPYTVGQMAMRTPQA